MESRKITEPWNSFLLEIDRKLSEAIELECLGGFIITQIYQLDRPTADVDIISVNPQNQSKLLREIAGKGSPLHRKYRVYLDFVRVARLPENYEERLVEIVPRTFRHLHLLALDPYDIALAKIERNIQRDREDVKHLSKVVPFDLGILKERYEQELRPVLGNPRREELTLKLWIEAIEEERLMKN